MRAFTSTCLAAIFALMCACSDPPQGPGIGGTDSGTSNDALTDAGMQDTVGGLDTGNSSSDTATANDALKLDAAVVDAATSQDSAAKDAGALADAQTTKDAAIGADTASTNDGGTPTDGGGQVILTCDYAEFSFKAPSGAQDVVVTGNWLGWNADVGAPMNDDDGDGTWEATVKLGGGAWQYKFVADGKWFTDPTNPDQVDDGFGGKNSVIVITACPNAIGPISAKADHVKGALDAEFKAGKGTLDASKVSVTVDGKAHPGGCKSAPSGGCKVAVSGLSNGIHDVRVSYDGHTELLKVYSGVSTDWRDAPIYFAMTDRFVNGDKTNDKPVGGTHKSLDWNGGDFAGIQQKIDDGYFTELGIGALWISWPAKQFEGAEDGGHVDQDGCGIDPKKANYKGTKYTAYHGYWPISLDEVEPRFGTLAQLQAMVNAAHAKGIRVLLDFTANHVHTASKLYKDKKDSGWFHLPAEVCQDVGWENKPITCWFTSYLADFDYDNPAVRDAVIESARQWVVKTGADGFRLDAVKHIEMSFVEQLRARMDAAFAGTGVDFYIVGETFTGDAGAIKAFVSDNRIHAQFDFPTNMQVLKAFAKEEIGLSAMDGTVRGIKGVYGKHSEWMSTFLGNHDIARFFSMAAGDISCGIWDIVSNQAIGWKKPPPATSSSDVPYRKLLLGFAYVFAVPGIPLVYYGDEYGLAGAGDPDNRRLWSLPTEKHGKDLLGAMKVLGKLRAELAPLRTGAWPAPLVNDGDFHVLARTIGLGADREAAIVAINRSGAEKSGSFDLKKVGVTKVKVGSKCAQTLVWADGKATACTVGTDMALSYKVPARSVVVWSVNQ